MASVELILLQRVENLGQMGEVVKVKPGYARNFLLPRSKALLASTASIRHLEHQKRLTEKRKAQQQKQTPAKGTQPGKRPTT